MLQMAALGLGFGIIVSSMTTKYRDLTHLVGFGVQLWMYGTPIVYPASMVPEKWHWALNLNPMAPIIEAFRYAFLGVGTVDFASIATSAVMTLLLWRWELSCLAELKKVSWIRFDLDINTRKKNIKSEINADFSPGPMTNKQMIKNNNEKTKELKDSGELSAAIDIRPVDFSAGSNVVIRVEELWKEYHLGSISHKSLSKDLQSWWARKQGKEDPNATIDQINLLSANSLRSSDTVGERYRRQVDRRRPRDRSHGSRVDSRTRAI